MFKYEKAYRQGEILIFKVKSLKGINIRGRNYEKPRRVLNGVIREGEKEGHEHKIVIRTCLECGTKNRLPDIIDENKAPVCGQCKKPLTIEKSTATLEMFGEETGALKTDEPVTLIHPEHKKVELPKGEYVVKVQKEATGKNKSASVKD